MAILDQLVETIKTSMKAKDTVRLDAARMAKSALKNKEIDNKGSLSEEDAQKVIATMIKQRRESIDQFAKAGRKELAEKEQTEIDFLETLLPPPLSEDEIREQVTQVITETGAAGPQDMGKVMKPLMSRLGTRADGAMVRRLVQEGLG